MNQEELFDKFLQRALTREESEQLKALLKQDPDAGRRFVEHVGETSLLIRVGSQLLSVSAAPTDELAVPPARSAIPGFSPFGWKWAAAAAGLLALTIAGWLALRAGPEFRATLATSSSEVTIVRNLESIPAEPGMALQQGDTLRVEPQARAIVTFDGEATRVELQGGAQAKFTVSHKGKRIELSEGALEATVALQPRNRPLTFLTLHAAARALGTTLVLASEVSSTRLEVNDGSVEFVRRSDGKALVVSKGFSATAGSGAEWCARPFLPAPWRSQDVGAVGLHGYARFDGTAFRVRGAGQDTCCKKDQLHYVYQPLPGDGEILVCVHAVEFTDPEAKASVMIRQSLKSASPQVSLGLTASGRLEFESRTGAESRVRRTGYSSTPCWLRLVRQADTIMAFKSADGTNWIQVASEDLASDERAYIGLGVTSFNHAALSTSIFEHVTVKIARPSQAN
jgi:ferric-dicitrate binding protein FerR (iron transport regulator)